ncbi:MAG: helix-turn-helix domain-containing protein [Ensifer adhaerens]
MDRLSNNKTGLSPQAPALSALSLLRGALTGVARTIAPGQNVSVEGAKRETVIGVVSGLIRFFRMTPDGRRHISRFVHAGGLIGVGMNITYRNSAEAVTTSKIIVFRAKSIEAGAGEDPVIRNAVFQALTEELTARDRTQLRLGRLLADERVADFLLELSDEAGDGVAASSAIVMSRADMADHLGVTIETVSRALHRFQKLGWLRLTDARHFTILRSGALRSFASGDSDIALPSYRLSHANEREALQCAA